MIRGELQVSTNFTANQINIVTKRDILKYTHAREKLQRMSRARHDGETAYINQT